jgi:hypothetical protein
MFNLKFLQICRETEPDDVIRYNIVNILYDNAWCFCHFLSKPQAKKPLKDKALPLRL